jgi:hypothetical protein
MMVPQETYRHWKKALAPLRRGTGHSPCFTPGDLLSVAIVRVLTVDLAVRVGALSAIAEALFEACNAISWPILERSKLNIDLATGRLQISPELENVVSETPVIVIPLRPLVSHLRGALLTDGEVDNQETLRFPPTPQPSKTKAVSTRGRS